MPYRIVRKKWNEVKADVYLVDETIAETRKPCFCMHDVQQDLSNALEYALEIQANTIAICMEIHTELSWFRNQIQDFLWNHEAEIILVTKQNKPFIFHYEPCVVCCSMGLAFPIEKLEESFSKCLLRLIDERGYSDPQVYKRANISRKLFNKIKNNEDYHPKKRTAVAFAFALELNVEETKDLLEKAGYALSHSRLFDVIVEHFLQEENYDIFALNEVLFQYNQPLLGA